MTICSRSLLHPLQTGSCRGEVNVDLHNLVDTSKGYIKPDFAKKPVSSVWTHEGAVVYLDKVCRLDDWLMLDIFVAFSSYSFQLALQHLVATAESRITRYFYQPVVGIELPFNGVTKAEKR